MRAIVLPSAEAIWWRLKPNFLNFCCSLSCFMECRVSCSTPAWRGRESSILPRFTAWNCPTSAVSVLCNEMSPILSGPKPSRCAAPPPQGSQVLKTSSDESADNSRSPHRSKVSASAVVSFLITSSLGSPNFSVIRQINTRRSPAWSPSWRPLSMPS